MSVLTLLRICASLRRNVFRFLVRAGGSVMIKKKQTQKPVEKPATKKKPYGAYGSIAAVVLVLAISFFLMFRSASKPAVFLDGDAGTVMQSDGLFSGSAAISPDAPTSTMPLTIKYDDQGDGARYEFRWYLNDRLVKEGAEPVLEPGMYKKGDSVYVEIVLFKGDKAGQPFKTVPKKIANGAPSPPSISLTPLNPAPGEEITAVAVAQDPDGDTVSYRYKWTVNGQLVPGLTPDTSKLNTRGFKKKDTVCVTITPFDGEIEGAARLSDLITLFNSGPKITSTPPTNISNGVYTYQVTAMDTDGDKLSYSLLTAPAGMQINSSTGLIQWALPGQVTEKQEIPVKIRVEDGDGGSISQAYSLFLEMK